MGEPDRLRVYDPAAALPREQPQLPTLREAWELWWLPEKRLSRSKATITDDRTSLDRWESACAEIFARRKSQNVPDSQKTYRTTYPVLQTANPPLDQIHKDLLVEVLAVWLAESRAADTYRKRFSAIKKLLQEAVDRDLLSKVPKFPEVPSTGKIRGFAGGVEPDEVDRLYRHADAADWPRLRGSRKKSLWWLAPAVWWRAWLVLWWCYGLRSQDVAGVKSGAEGLLWESIRDSARCPVPGAKVDYAGGWLFAVPQKTQRAKGQPVIAPLLPVVRRHLAAFKDLDESRIFPNGRSHQKFYAAWGKIVAAAGVPDDVTISAAKTRRGQIVRSIRKGASNNWDEASGGLLGEWVLGHANLGVNASHYKSIARPMVEAAEKLLLPPSFADETLLPKAQRKLIS